MADSHASLYPKGTCFAARTGAERQRGALGTAGHMGPALRSAAIIQSGQGRPPLQRDGEDAVPYILCHCEERSDATIRSPQPKETDSHASGYPKGTCFAVRTGSE